MPRKSILKKEIVRKLASRLDVTPKSAAVIYDVFAAAVIGNIFKNSEVQLDSFGTFKIMSSEDYISKIFEKESSISDNLIVAFVPATAVNKFLNTLSHKFSDPSSAKINRQDIVENMRQKYAGTLPPDEIYDAVIDIVKTAVTSGHIVRILNLGSFEAVRSKIYTIETVRKRASPRNNLVLSFTTDDSFERQLLNK